jgi:uncharacterized membrane protein
LRHSKIWIVAIQKLKNKWDWRVEILWSHKKFYFWLLQIKNRYFEEKKFSASEMEVDVFQTANLANLLEKKISTIVT